MSEIRIINSTVLRQIRLKSGMTQAQLAEAIGTKENYYAKIERGVAVPSITIIAKLAKELKVKSSAFLAF